MPVIRTPEERFNKLPGYPFKPNYMEIRGMRLHYVDEGKGDPILCVHGEPSWSYLYRKMIKVMSPKCRVVAPDFFGFGKSDKFTERDEYSIKMHHDTLVSFIEELNLDKITLVCQDWGGLIGLPVATELQDRFARLVIMNTGLPTGDTTTEAFLQWRASADQLGATEPKKLLDISFSMGFANAKDIPADIIAAYYAPFPDAKYMAGAAKWPLLVPVKRDDPGAEENYQARQVLKKWQKPALIMFSDKDPVTKGGDVFFRNLIPTAKDQPEITIRDAGHFLQEDKGEELAQNILDFIARTPIK
jgi:haloalkane dehalogenase